MHLLKRRASWCATSRIINFIALSFALLLCLFSAAPPEAAFADGAAECMTELSTGTVIHSVNASAKLPMASTTKIMTALIIIEDCDPDEIITVPDEAVGVEGSSMYLKHGEQISVRDLVYGLMLRSGNDSAAALAIHHSGNTENFAGVMNERARSMGALNTNFTNPSGLPDQNHYTTAADLCKIACTAMKNDSFKKVVSTKNYTGKFRSFVNKNKLLSMVEGANGIKTGYTLKAGRCLVSSAERNGMGVVCVVLNCHDMYERCSCLLNEAFERYSLKKIDGGRVFMCDGIPCTIRCDNSFLVDNKKEMSLNITKTNCSARVNRGDEVGKLEIYCENDLIFSANLYSIISRNKIF